VSDFEDMVDLIKKTTSAIVPPEHPQLIDGTLYVTPQQYQALLDWVIAQPIDLDGAAAWGITPPPVSGIPVVVVRDQMPLPDGRTLVYSKVSPDRLYIFPEGFA
jgi:hypothetical protein